MILMADGRRPFLRTSWAVSNWTKVPRPSFTVMHPFDASVNKKFSKSILIDVDSSAVAMDNHTTLQDRSIMLGRGGARGRTPAAARGRGRAWIAKDSALSSIPIAPRVQQGCSLPISLASTGDSSRFSHVTRAFWKLADSLHRRTTSRSTRPCGGETWTPSISAISGTCNSATA